MWLIIKGLPLDSHAEEMAWTVWPSIRGFHEWAKVLVETEQSVRLVLLLDFYQALVVRRGSPQSMVRFHHHRARFMATPPRKGRLASRIRTPSECLFPSRLANSGAHATKRTWTMRERNRGGTTYCSTLGTRWSSSVPTWGFIEHHCSGSKTGTHEPNPQSQNRSETA
jgi:hypothetical protein